MAADMTTGNDILENTMFLLLLKMKKRLLNIHFPQATARAIIYIDECAWPCLTAQCLVKYI